MVDGDDTCALEQVAARPARGDGDVGGSAVKTDTEACSGCNSIGFGMDRAEAMASVVELTAAVIVNRLTVEILAVRFTWRAAVVTGGEDAVLPHDDAADLLSGAGGAGGNDLRDAEEVVGPGFAGQGFGSVTARNATQ